MNKHNEILNKLDLLIELVKEMHRVEMMGTQWQEIEEPMSKDSRHAN